MMAVLGRQGIGFEFELLQRIRERHGNAQTRVYVVVNTSVETVRHSRRLAARNRNRHLSIPACAVSERGASLDGAAGDQDQIAHASSVERQFQHPRVVHHLADSGGPRLHQCSVRLDLNLITDLADSENGIHSRAAADLQHNAALHVRAEPRQRRFQPVRTDWQIRQCVGTGLIGHCRPAEPCVCLHQRDFYAGQDRSRLISHRPADLSGRLRKDNVESNQQKQKPGYYGGLSHLLKKHSLTCHFLSPPNVPSLRRTIVE